MEHKASKVIRYVNLPRFICTHVVGEKHSHKHRMSVGFVLMVIGVGTAKSFAEIHIFGLDFVGDVIGYFLHGVGAVPYVDYFITLAGKD